ncbi:MAG: hypothetical protein DWQ35_08420 [Planctomycetota bacterium]|mgnify:CR=1 FL=1|nr:MAG: hypothetical protein DWQ35_08420 [Planctomycetota bacterium]REK22055.1 MAG: hypothetical protein DWQ42_18105 [Planctomycetota bacterium]REK44463.1 MAG: hypothetical protein DWQ46_09390 [Planctomycetota bacterium]
MFLFRFLFRRLVAVPMLVAAAVSVPYFLKAKDPWRPVKQLFPSGNAQRDALPQAALDPTGFAPRRDTPVADLGKPRLEPVQVYAAEEVFTLDMTIDDILRRWPRVSTGLSELELFGYRVPLVTGIAEHDLAGSLTYYFDSGNVCQRLAFEGTTGNADELIRLLASQHNLRQAPAEGPSVYVFRSAWNGQAVSELRIRPAAIVRADQPHRRFDVSFYVSRFQPTWIQRQVMTNR